MSLPALTNSLSAPLLALQDLVHQEAVDAKRPKLSASKVSWWTDVLRVRGSAVPNVWRPVLYLTVWATIIAVADFHYGKHWRLSNGVLPLLSVVVGLMLVFRNTTAFARWDEGRKTFTSLSSTTRSLSRSIWVSVGAATPRPAGANPLDPISPEEHRRKVRALRLIVAFVVAAKRHIRGEYGVDYEDLRALLPPGFYTTGEAPGYGYDSADADQNRAPGSFGGPVQSEEPESSETTGSPKKTEAGRRVGSDQTTTLPSSPPKRAGKTRRPWESQRAELDENAPLLSPSISKSSLFSHQSAGPKSPRSPLFKRNPKDAGVATDGYQAPQDVAVVVHDYLSRPSLPLPFVITHQLHLYLASCKARGLLESVGPAGYNAMVASLGSMTEAFSQISALSELSIPAIYGIHMKQCTTLYLLALPLTLLDIGWTLIPVVTIVAFTLMGIEALARECEDPFGFDSSDLPMDLLTASLRSELEHTIARLGSSSDDLMI